MSITPEMVEAEARRFALATAGQLLLKMAEEGINEEQLAVGLGVSIRTMRFYLRGQNWRSFLAIAAICLALGVRMDAKPTSL